MPQEPPIGLSQHTRLRAAKAANAEDADIWRWFASFVEERRIGCAEVVRQRVRELMLDHFRLLIGFLMQDRARHRRKTVSRDLRARVVAEPP